MSIIQQLIGWDKELFLLLNGLHNSFFDGFMYTYTKVLVWIPLYVALAFVFVKNARKESVWLILALALCVLVADQIASGFFKETVERLRPSRNPDFEGIVHLVKNRKGGNFGFVSSHAANTFGVALLASLFIRNKIFTISLFAWSLVNCYSRIYLGLHYPADIAGGIIVGTFSALLIYFLIKKFRPQSLPSYVSGKDSLWPVYTLLASVGIIVLYAAFFFHQ